MKVVVDVKKILFVLNGFRFGGLTKVNTVIANELNECYDVAIYNTSHRNKPAFPVKVPVYQERYLFGHKTYFFTRLLKKVSQHTKLQINPNKLEYYRISKLIQYIQEKDIDVIILNTSQITYASKIKERVSGVTVIGWLHNNADVYLNKFFRGFRKHFIEAVNVCDFLVCLTRSDALSFKKYTNHAVCIYNPATMSPTTLADLNKKMISFVGRIDIKQKGIDYLCEIAKDIPDDWKISVAGPGKKRHKKVFEKLQSIYETSGKLEYVGALRGHKLNRHYEESSIFMMTSRWEGMPLVLMEAMSFGLPIIAFEQSGSNEVLDFGKSGLLVKQGSIEHFNRELKRLIDDYQLRVAYSKASLERVKHFEMESILEKWHQMISRGVNDDIYNYGRW